MRSAHKQPNASTGLMLSISMRAQRTPPFAATSALAELKGHAANLAACPTARPYPAAWHARPQGKNDLEARRQPR